MNETLCNDWVYQSVTGVPDDQVQIDGNTISFLLMGGGPMTFTYTVRAPDTPGADCNISGVLTDAGQNKSAVAGPREVTVCNCGDVNCVDGVDMTDVILLYYNVTYYPDPTYSLASTWAGDVNCANGIDMTDVILLYYNVTYYPDPRYELTCCGARKYKE